MHCKRAQFSRPSQQHGVALAILVWFIAAMSLLVGAVVMQARVDVKLTQLHAAKARAVAIGDGAINLALMELLLREKEGEFDPRISHVSQQELGGILVQVNFTPVSGLIDINLAPEELLYAVFLGAGNIDENVARELAISVIEWRTAEGQGSDAGPQIRFGRFEAIEDLLLVPGMSRQVFQVVRESVYVSQKGQGTLDVMAAPESVLLSLGMSAEDSQAYMQARRGEDAVSIGIPESIDPSFLSQTTLPGFRVDAIVSVDETSFLRRRWVDRLRSGTDGLPWHFFRTEAARAISAEDLESFTARELTYAGQ